MTTSAFVTLLNMSFTGAWVAALVMLLRMPLKRAPKAFSYALWAVVLFRLLCPFTFQSAASLIPPRMDTLPGDILTAQAQPLKSGIARLDELSGRVISSVSPVPTPAASVDPVDVLLHVGMVVWLAGMAAFLAYAAIDYLRLRRRVADATRIEGNVYETDRITSPFVLGVLRPRIYVPLAIPPEQLSIILEHERTHIRRLDPLVKLVAYLALALHWFNPMIWASYRLMCKDMELSCDEAVLRRTDGDIRRVYSMSLLSLSVRRAGLLGPLAFGESAVKSRVRNALRFKRPAPWIIALGLVPLGMLALGCVANPPRDAASTRAGGYDLDALYAKRTALVDGGGSLMDTKSLTELVAMLPKPDAELGEGVVMRNDASDDRVGMTTNGVTVMYRFMGTDDEALRKRTNGLLYDYTATCMKNGLLLLSLVDDLEDVSFLIAGKDTDDAVTSQLTINRAALAYAGHDDLASLWEGDRAALVELLQSLDYDTIPLSDIRSLAAKGDALSLSDFDGYRGAELGADPSYFVTYYNVEGDYGLSIESLGSGKIDSAMLSKSGAEGGGGVDIRYGDLEAFLDDRVVWSAQDTPAATVAPTFHPLPSATVEPQPTDIESAISRAILDANRDEPGELSTEAHTTLAIVEDGDRVTAYVMALHQRFRIEDDGFQSAGGSHMPVAIAFDRTGAGYALAKYQRPMDGSGYGKSIREAFPADVVEDALDTQKFIAAHMQACYAQAVAASGMDTDKKVDELLAAICVDPDAVEEVFAQREQWGDTTNTEYRELLNYGRHTLKRFVERLDMMVPSEETEARVMEAACYDIARILGVEMISAPLFQHPWKWYDAYRDVLKDLIAP